jgi:hypothetical protein
VAGFETVTIAAAEVAAHPGLVSAMLGDAVQAVVVTGVYDPADCALVAARVAAPPGAMPRSEFPGPFRSGFLGMNLNLAAPDLGEYRAALAGFEAGLAAVFAGMAPLVPRVAGLLSALDGGRPYGPPPGGYMPTTLRHHRPGGFIPAHLDDEQAERPSYAGLLPLIRGEFFSFVLAFAQPDSGGVLEVFGQHPAGRRMTEIDGAEGVPAARFALAPGEMVLFRSGRRLHRLTPVEGPRPRITACSFMAESRDGARVFCWG